MRIRLLHKDQRGLTLVELMVVIAIAGLITGGIATTIFQVFNINTRSSNHMLAVRQVQQAGDSVSRDVLQAQNVDTEPELLKATWVDWETGNAHEVIYTVEDDKLWRSHSTNDGDPTVTYVAEYIDPDPEQTSFGPSGTAVIFKVTATVGGQSETRVYEIKPRPN